MTSSASGPGPRSRIRGVVLLATAGLPAVAATAFLEAAAEAATTLGASAARSGRSFGTAISAGKLGGPPATASGCAGTPWPGPRSSPAGCSR